MQCQVPLFSGSSTNAAMMQICKDPMCNSMPFLSLRFVIQPTRQIIEAFCNALQRFFAHRLTFESVSTIVASAKTLNSLSYFADSFDISLGIRLQSTFRIFAYMSLQWRPSTGGRRQFGAVWVLLLKATAKQACVALCHGSDRRQRREANALRLPVTLIPASLNFFAIP